MNKTFVVFYAVVLPLALLVGIVTGHWEPFLGGVVAALVTFSVLWVGRD